MDVNRYICILVCLLYFESFFVKEYENRAKNRTQDKAKKRVSEATVSCVIVCDRGFSSTSAGIFSPFFSSEFKKRSLKIMWCLPLLNCLGLVGHKTTMVSH
jgi:hypothetical protein